MSASAKAPPPPRRSEPPPEDEDFDEAPTAMFTHPVKYTYDPDAPPQQPGLLDDEEDDENEPPTAIHVSPYRGDGPGGRPPVAPWDDEPASLPQGARNMPTPSPAAGQPANPPPFAPPGVAPQAQPQYAPPALQPQPQYAQQQPPVYPQDVDPRMFQTQQLSSMRMPPGYGGAGVTPAADPMSTWVDPDAAPVWLKAIALSSVVSAITVLGVLGWMLSVRF